MWRVDRDETSLTDAEKLAWDFILPYRHVPILDSDHDQAKRLAAYLNRCFTEQALKAAVERDAT